MWRAASKKVVDAGFWMGEKTLSALARVDPDVYRHLAQFPMLAYSLFSPRKVRVRAGKNDGHAPLILVHGMAGNRGNFLPMASYLWFHGRKRSYRIDFGRESSIKKMSNRLALFIKRVIRVTGEPKVEIVAYSLGGIVSRLAIADHSLEPLVKTLITLGTPHHGTFPARYANTELTRQLLPDSPVIQRLKRNRWPKGVRGVTFWSKNDLLIFPPKAATVRGTKQIDLSPFTHFSYLVDPKSWQSVRKALRG